MKDTLRPDAFFEREFSVGFHYTKMDLHTLCKDTELFERVEAMAKRGFKPDLSKEEKERLGRLVKNFTSIYFLATEDRSMIKIGKSKDVTKRVACIKTMSPVPIHLECHFRSHEDMEYYLHDQFASTRSHGEWFRASPELYKLIDAVKEGGVYKVVDVLKEFNYGLIINKS